MPAYSRLVITTQATRKILPRAPFCIQCRHISLSLSTSTTRPTSLIANSNPFSTQSIPITCRSYRAATASSTFKRSLHTTSVASGLIPSRWFRRGRGMRRRIGAWADSFGLTDQRPRAGGSGLRVDDEEPLGNEELYVMPGWAVVKFRDGHLHLDGDKGDVKGLDAPFLESVTALLPHLEMSPAEIVVAAPVPFDLHVSISGFCSQSRPPSRVTRTQRVMLSVVKRFAALPNLPGVDPDKLPMGPLPTAVGMAFMEQAEQDGEGEDKEVKAYTTYKSKRSRRPVTSQSAQAATRPSPSSSISSSSISTISTVNPAFNTREALTTAHQNLQARLSPFWSSILPNRRVLFDIYANDPEASATAPLSKRRESIDSTTSENDEEANIDDNLPNHSEPIHSFELITDASGHFSSTAVIPWEKLCTSPATVAEVFSSGSTTESKATPMQGWKLRLRARLDYEALPVAETDRSYRDRLRRALSSYGQDATDELPSPAAATREQAASAGSAAGSTETGKEAYTGVGMEKLSLNSPDEPQVVQWTSIRIGRADGVHVISDLDDTVKHSDILAGPREVFRNVFCRPLTEICVPEMDAMYRRLDERGVEGFHFVSNSPSQLFPSIRRFLTINNFPSRHSIKLKYYGGRSIFSSLYESPAGRKRASLTELFEAFPSAQMVMLGDSAEQDLELYVEFARAYPGRVALIAIRDVTSDRADEVWKTLEGVQIGLEGLSDEATGGEKDEEAAKVILEQNQPATSTSSQDQTTSLTPGTSGASPRPAIPPRRPTRQASASSLSSTAASLANDEELRSLSSSQQKILQRAATWETRKAKAVQDVPDGTAVYFFKDPVGEIERPIQEVVERYRSSGPEC